MGLLLSLGVSVGETIDPMSKDVVDFHLNQDQSFVYQRLPKARWKKLNAFKTALVDGAKYIGEHSLGSGEVEKILLDELDRNEVELSLAGIGVNSEP